VPPSCVIGTSSISKHILATSLLGLSSRHRPVTVSEINAFSFWSFTQFTGYLPFWCSFSNIYFYSFSYLYFFLMM
jgi:hypothetical protein